MFTIHCGQKNVPLQIQMHSLKVQVARWVAQSIESICKHNTRCEVTLPVLSNGKHKAVFTTGKWERETGSNRLVSIRRNEKGREGSILHFRAQLFKAIFYHYDVTYRVFIKYCVFFRIFKNIPYSVFSRCQCVYTPGR